MNRLNTYGLMIPILIISLITVFVIFLIVLARRIGSGGSSRGNDGGDGFVDGGHGYLGIHFEPCRNRKTFVGSKCEGVIVCGYKERLSRAVKGNRISDFPGA